MCIDKGPGMSWEPSPQGEVGGGGTGEESQLQRGIQGKEERRKQKR